MVGKFDLTYNKKVFNIDISIEISPREPDNGNPWIGQPHKDVILYTLRVRYLDKADKVFIMNDPLLEQVIDVVKDFDQIVEGKND